MVVCLLLDFCGRSSAPPSPTENRHAMPMVYIYINIFILILLNKNDICRGVVIKIIYEKPANPRMRMYIKSLLILVLKTFIIFF